MTVTLTLLYTGEAEAQAPLVTEGTHCKLKSSVVETPTLWSPPFHEFYAAVPLQTEDYDYKNVCLEETIL